MNTRNRTFQFIRRSAPAILIGTLGCAGLSSSADPVKSVAPDEAAVQWVDCGGWPKGCEAALVWGDWEKGPHAWYVRAPKGYVFPRHHHTAAEHIVVLRGRIVGGVDGSAEMMVTPGTYWGFAHKAIHWARCEDSCLMYIYYDKAADVTFY